MSTRSPLLMAAAPALLLASTASAQTIGEQVRIDESGPDWANETTASAAEPFPNVVMSGWNDYRFSPDIRAGFSLTLDGGQTWDDFILRPAPAFQSSVEGDPMMAHDDRTGTLWAGAISFFGGGIYVARLDPGESQVNDAVMAHVGGADKCWMAAGPRPGLPDTTRLYITFNVGVVWSDDMGDTFTSPNSLGDGIGFLPRIGPEGQLYVAYWDFDDGVLLKRSLNGGASFTTHTIATRMDVWGTQSGSRVPGQFRVPSLNYIDVDPNDGTLYAVYFDTTDVQGGNSNVDIYFCKSTNQGTSWTTPVVINNDSSPGGDQFFPWIEVDQAGRVHVMFLDSRNVQQDDNVPNGMFDAYYQYSDDGGDTWTEFRLTPETWSSAGVSFIGDYSGMAVAANKVYPSYIQMDPGGDENIYVNPIEFDEVVGGPDVNGDGVVGVLDLVLVIANWGTCPPECPPCLGDANGDCEVDVMDLVAIIAGWD